MQKFSVAAEYRSQIKTGRPVAGSTCGYATLSPAQHLQQLISMGTVDRGYLGITTIHTGGVQQHEQTLRKTHISVQVAEIFPANPEKVSVKLSN